MAIKNHTGAPLPSVSFAGGADPALEFIVLKHRMRLCRRCRLRLCGGGRDTIYSTGRLSVYAMLSLGTGRALHALHKPCIGSDAVCKTAALTTCHTRARSRQSALHSKVPLSNHLHVNFFSLCDRHEARHCLPFGCLSLLSFSLLLLIFQLDCQSTLCPLVAIEFSQ